MKLQKFILSAINPAKKGRTQFVPVWSPKNGDSWHFEQHSEEHSVLN
jgi:hypothetical protein